MPYDIQFTDQSQGGNSHIISKWQWDFGDGGVSSEQSPLHSFDSPGEYNVSLTVTNDCGRSDTSTQCIKVLGGDGEMGTYTEAIEVVDGNTITVNVPVEEPTAPVEFVDAHTTAPLVGKTAELLTTDEATVLQTKTTDANGVATFTDVAHGNYKVRVTY